MANEVRVKVSAQDDASAKLDRISGKAKGMGAALGKLKLPAIAATAAIAGIGVAGIKMAVDLDRGLREVQTLLPGLSEQGFNVLKADVLDFSKTIGITTNQVVPALYQAISAGVPRDNVFEFLETAGKASIGGVTDLETAVDGLTSVVNAFGKETISTEEAADLMFTTVRLGKTTFGELSASLFNVAPIAAASGVSFQEVSAALAAMTAQGIPTAVATTQLRSAIQALTAPTKRQEAAALDLNIVLGKEQVETKGLQGAMVDLMQQTGGNMTILRRLVGSVEGVNAILALAGDQANIFTRALAATAEATGANEAAFETMDQSVSRLWQRVKTQLSVAMIELGEQALPAVQDVLSWFNGNLPGIIQTLNQLGSVVVDLLTPGFTVLSIAVKAVAKFLGLTNIEAREAASGISEADSKAQVAAIRFSELERRLSGNAVVSAEFLSVTRSLTTGLGESAVESATVAEAMVTLALREDDTSRAAAVARANVDALAESFGITRAEMVGVIEAFTRGVSIQDALANATELGILATDLAGKAFLAQALAADRAAAATAALGNTAEEAASDLLTLTARAAAAAGAMQILEAAARGGVDGVGTLLVSVQATVTGLLRTEVAAGKLTDAFIANGLAAIGATEELDEAAGGAGKLTDEAEKTERVIRGLTRAVRDLTAEFRSTFTDAITDAADQVLARTLRPQIENIVTAFGHDLPEGIANAIRSVLSLGDATSAELRRIIDSLGVFLGEEVIEPFLSAGESAGEAFGDGFTTAARAAVEEASRILQAAVQRSNDALVSGTKRAERQGGELLDAKTIVLGTGDNGIIQIDASIIQRPGETIEETIARETQKIIERVERLNDDPDVINEIIREVRKITDPLLSASSFDPEGQVLQNGQLLEFAALSTGETTTINVTNVFEGDVITTQESFDEAVIGAIRDAEEAGAL